MKPPLAIIAGGGLLPLMLYRHCVSENRPCSVFGIKGAYSETLWENIPLISIPLGNIGELFSHLHTSNITHVTLAGNVKRPKFSSLSCDKMGIRLLGRIIKCAFKGDDTLLKIVVTFIEEAGFQVIGADQILSSLVAHAGEWGIHKASTFIKKDILCGIEIAHAIGKYDIGQSIVVSEGRVIGIEAIEGTDALIARCGAYEKAGNILIKVKKPEQEERVDLPTIGPSTVNNAVKHGFLGIAVEARKCLVLDYPTVVKIADDAGMFIIGIAT